MPTDPPDTTETPETPDPDRAEAVTAQDLAAVFAENMQKNMEDPDFDARIEREKAERFREIRARRYASRAPKPETDPPE